MLSPNCYFSYLIEVNMCWVLHSEYLGKLSPSRKLEEINLSLDFKIGHFQFVYLTEQKNSLRIIVFN